MLHWYYNLFINRKNVLQSECSANFKTISVGSDTTAEDVLKHITPLLNCSDMSQYSLIELCLDKGVSDREVSLLEKPLELIQKARRVNTSYSIDIFHFTYFCIYLGVST